jgi:GTP cyclohydrolase II
MTAAISPGAAEPFAIDAEATIPTRHGPMRIVVFRWGDQRDHVAMVRGAVSGHDVLVSVHTGCMTGEVFGSLACDCARQLDGAMASVAAAERGVVVYLRRPLLDPANDAARPSASDPLDHGAAAALLRALEVRSVRPVTGDGSTQCPTQPPPKTRGDGR